MSISLERKFWGKEFRTPFFLASGTSGYGLELFEMGCLKDVAGVITKATTLHPCEGNAPPRIFETRFGLLNSIGLANPGVDAVVEEILPDLNTIPCEVLVNVSGYTRDEFAEVVKRLECSSVPFGYEINVSCPNVSRGGDAFGIDPREVANISALVRKATKKPFSVKLTANGGDIVSAAQAAEYEGADAVTVCNTFLGMKIHWRTNIPALSRGTGGYSSPALFPLVVARVFQVADAVGIPVIASGGISCADDVLEIISAGAEMVELGSSLLKNPWIASQLANEVRIILEEDVT